MKKFLIALILTLCASTAYAQAPYCLSTGLKTADAIIHTGPVDLCGVLTVTDGTNAATCIVYGALTNTSGTELFKGVVAGANNFGGALFPSPARNSTGLYLTVSGTNAACILYYYPR